MKRLILIVLLLVSLCLMGCGNRDTYESECYGNCIDSSGCNNFQAKGDLFYSDIKGKKSCQTECFNLCYGFGKDVNRSDT